MRRKRIIYLTSTAASYGGENALLDVVSNLVARTSEAGESAYEPLIVAPESGPLITAAEKMGIRTLIVPFCVLHRTYFHLVRVFLYLLSFIPSVVRMLRLLREVRPAIVHTNNVLVLPGAIAAKLLQIPHVWHVREIVETHHIHPTLWKIWRWLILTFSVRVICISRAVREQFGSSSRAIVLHDGVDVDFFRPHPPVPKADAAEESIVRIGVVGRLEHRRKGQDIFIDAARLVLDRRPECRFFIVGHERDEFAGREQSLHEAVRRLGIQDKVEFLGYLPREQVASLLCDLDLLILCSKQPEGLGLVLLEAMACGKPVIAPAEGGPLDIVEDHRNGLLIPPRDPQALAEAILSLADHPEQRRRMGNEGRERVVSFHQAEQAAANLAALYREILRAG